MISPEHSGDLERRGELADRLPCVHQMFETQAAKHPSKAAVEASGKTLTYQELNEQANALAAQLRNQGVGPNTLVGVCLERSLEMVVAIYGVLKAGGAYVPLDPAYPTERLQFMAQAAGLKCLITERACAGSLQELPGVHRVYLDATETWWDPQQTGNVPSLATPDDLIYVIFTSGSTGQPKAAAVYHRGFSNLVQWFVREFEIDNQARNLLISSLSFDLTQKNLYATLCTGGTLHLYPPRPYDISLLGELIRSHGITLINCTPSAFYPLIEPLTDMRATELASLRVVCLGGEPISIERVGRWLRHSQTQAEIANTYGPTECTDICGFYRLRRDNLDLYDFVPLGRAITNVQMIILDTQMQACPAGVAGELCVGGAGVGAGYLNDSELTKTRFVPHELPNISSPLLYRTGDQARCLPDGVFQFLGRLDHQVKIRGYRIELPEIERALEQHPAVREASVVLRGPPESGEQQLVGCVTTQHADLSDAELRNFLAQRVPPHMLPSSFRWLPALPLSPNGKVDRRALTELVNADLHPLVNPKPETKAGDQVDNSEISSEGPDGVAGRGAGGDHRQIGDLTGQLQQVWCELLNRDQAGLDDNFFDLGGDSLRLARLHQVMEGLLKRSFPITDLFAHPTIRGIVRHFDNTNQPTDQLQRLRDRAKLQRQSLNNRRRSRS